MKRSFIFISTIVLSVFLGFSVISFADWNDDKTSYDVEGINVTGVYDVPGDGLYCFDDNGIVLTDVSREVNGYLYYFGQDGAGKAVPGVLSSGFYEDSYYLSSGKKYIPENSGVHGIGGGHYYVYKSGKVFKPSEDGVYKLANGYYFYVYTTGQVHRVSKKGKNSVDGKKYYYVTNYRIYANGTYHFAKKNKKTYRFAPDGHLIKGWVTTSKGKYYMSRTTYARLHSGVKTIDGDKYYFSKSGKMQRRHWSYKNGLKRYYFGKSGKAIKGTSTYIGKYKYYFNKKGICQTNLVKYKGYKWVLKHSLLVKVNRQRSTVTIYAKNGNKGYTIPVIAFICTTGSWDRPTDKGTYYTDATYRWKELGGKTKEMDNGEKCYGQYVTHIYGAVYFHSIVCAVNGNNHTLYTSAYNWLGNPGSHGCVRLRTGDAYIMYNLAKQKSLKVKIYDSKTSGAFGKPKIKKITTNYDPTDPNIKKK